MGAFRISDTCYICVCILQSACIWISFTSFCWNFLGVCEQKLLFRLFKTLTDENMLKNRKGEKKNVVINYPSAAVHFNPFTGMAMSKKIEFVISSILYRFIAYLLTVTWQNILFHILFSFFFVAALVPFRNVHKLKCFILTVWGGFSAYFISFSRSAQDICCVPLHVWYYNRHLSLYVFFFFWNMPWLMHRCSWVTVFKFHCKECVILLLFADYISLATTSQLLPSAFQSNKVREVYACVCVCALFFLYFILMQQIRGKTNEQLIDRNEKERRK